MVLCFDIGNSNIVASRIIDDKIKDTIRLVTNTLLTADEYYQRLKDYIGNDNLEGVAVSCVVPLLDRVFYELFTKYYKIKPFFVVPGIKSGIKLKIEEPKSLGSDLLCDAIGASQKYGYPVMIADLGTASKLIVVSDKKEYLGGMIAPGMEKSLDSLIQGAAKLSHTSMECPPHVVSNNTTECIQSGLIYGTASMIDGMIERSMKELGYDKCKVVLTGGLSVLIKDILNTKVYYEPNILIEGLYSLYLKNK